MLRTSWSRLLATAIEVQVRNLTFCGSENKVPDQEGVLGLGHEGSEPGRVLPADVDRSFRWRRRRLAVTLTVTPRLDAAWRPHPRGLFHPQPFRRGRKSKSEASEPAKHQHCSCHDGCKARIIPS